MKIKKPGIVVFLSGLILSLFLSPSLAGLEKNRQKEKKESKPVYIPKEVKAVFEKGMPNREVRQDIPFSVLKVLYFPAQKNLHTVFLFKIKNADLGFAPFPETSAFEEKKKEKEEALAAAETEAPKLQAKAHIFIQLNKLENGKPAEVAYEVYARANMQIDSSGFEPEKEDIYSLAYPSAPGHYLASVAVASQNLERIGTQYLEFSLPDPASFTDKIDTTPLFFFKALPDLPAPETRSIVHKGCFTYSILQFKPILEPIFPSGDNLELFFYIFGAKSAEDMKYNIELNYEVLKAEEKVVRWAPRIYNAPLIDQALPLERTVLIKSDSGERTEKQSLEPGKYTLSLIVTDKASGKSVNKAIDFEVK